MTINGPITSSVGVTDIPVNGGNEAPAAPVSGRDAAPQTSESSIVDGLDTAVALPDTSEAAAPARRGTEGLQPPGSGGFRVGGPR